MSPFLIQENLNGQFVPGDESGAHQTSVEDQRSTQCGAYPYSCNVCNKSFNNKKVLKDHRGVHSKMWPFCCNACSKLFRKEIDLRVHQCLPPLARPFFCDACNKSFKCLSDLKRHQRRHNGDQFFVWCVYQIVYRMIWRLVIAFIMLSAILCDVSNKLFSTKSKWKNLYFVHNQKYLFGIVGKQGYWIS
jgi:KRAB domain-containing zinc finger protein